MIIDEVIQVFGETGREDLLKAVLNDDLVLLDVEDILGDVMVRCGSFEEGVEVLEGFMGCLVEDVFVPKLARRFVREAERFK